MALWGGLRSNKTSYVKWLETLVTRMSVVSGAERHEVEVGQSHCEGLRSDKSSIVVRRGRVFSSHHSRRARVRLRPDGRED